MLEYDIFLVLCMCQSNGAHVFESVAWESSTVTGRFDFTVRFF